MSRLATLLRGPVRLNRRSPLARGLVGWWPTIGGMGGTLHDKSGRFTDGTITGATWQNNAGLGRWLDYGATDYTALGALPQFDGVTALTIAAWVSPDTVTGEQAIVGQWKDDGFVYRFMLERSADELLVAFYDGADYLVVSTTAANLSANTTYHVVTTWQAGVAAAEIYVNGVSQSVSVDVANALSALPSSIASDALIGAAATGEKRWNGQIGDTAIWSRALSASEVASLYHRPWQLYAQESPVWIPSGATPTAYDASISFGRSMAVSQGGGATAGAGLSLAQSRTMSMPGNAATMSALSLGESLATTLAGMASGGAALSLGREQGQSQSGAAASVGNTSLAHTRAITPIAAASALATLSLAHDMAVVLAASAASEAGTTLATTLGITLGNGQTVQATMTLARSAGLTIDGVRTTQGGVALTLDLASTYAGKAVAVTDLVLARSQALVAIGAAIASAGLSLDMLADMAISATSISASIVTPDSRTYTVPLELRTYTVKAENRTYTVKAEDRTYEVDA